MPILDYLQLVEQRRRDVETLNVFLADERQRSRFVEHRLRSGRPVYVEFRREVPYVNAVFEYLPACKCYRVQLRSTVPDSPAPPAAG